MMALLHHTSAMAGQTISTRSVSSILFLIVVWCCKGMKRFGILQGVLRVIDHAQSYTGSFAGLHFVHSCPIAGGVVFCGLSVFAVRHSGGPSSGKKLLSANFCEGLFFERILLLYSYHVFIGSKASYPKGCGAFFMIGCVAVLA